MSSAAPLGEFEQIALLAILRLDENAYGVTIRAEITACTNREPAPGALYTTLDRLQEKGLVTSPPGRSHPPGAAGAPNVSSPSPPPESRP